MVLKGTMILAMEIEQASAKVCYRRPDDDGGEDAALDACAGEIPIITFLRRTPRLGGPAVGDPDPTQHCRPGRPTLAASSRSGSRAPARTASA
jgi:hypothetical protein